MLLHSGSGLHRHEYSAPASPTMSKRVTLVRSAFTSPAARPLPTRYDSTIKLPKVSTTEIRRSTGGISFVNQVKEEEDRDGVSDDEKSIMSPEENEEAFGIDRKSTKKKKTPKVTTSYAIAHPAPTMRQKKQFMALRPQLLLQLQRVSAATRPMPIVDVLPSAVFVPRLAKKFPIIFKVLGGLGLGPNDILCVKSEDYGISDRDSSGSDSDDDGWASRDVEAVICQAKKSEACVPGQVEIVFSSGSKWTAVPVSGCIYEFTSIDEHGLKTTARWVRRAVPRSTSDMKGPTTPKKDTKFNFSILDPKTRRHPVIASLTSNTLDIPDTYTLLSPSHQKKNSIDAETIASADLEYTPEEPSEKSIVTVSDSLRKLIQITSVWVTLRQGWSPNFRYDDQTSCETIKTPNHNTPTSNASSHGRGRSVSLDYKRRHTDQTSTRTGAETPESIQGSFSSAGGFSKKKRKSSSKCPIMGGSDGVGEVFNTNGCRSVNPKRSTSTGAAFMAKVAARKAGTGNNNTTTGPPSTVASDSDRESLQDHSPPRRSVTMSATVGASRSTLSINEGGSKLRKRVSSPSPLVAVYSMGESNSDGTVTITNLPRPTASTSQPFNSLAKSGAIVASSTTSATSGSKQSSTKTRRSKRSGSVKKSTWGKFTGLFSRKTG